MTTDVTAPAQGMPGVPGFGWSPVVARILVAGVVVLLALCVGDKVTLNLAERLCWLMLVIAVLTDGRSPRGRVIPVLLLGFGVPLLAVLAARVRGADFAVLIPAVMRYQPVLLWLFLCWIAAPLLANPENSNTPSGRMRRSLALFPLLSVGIAMVTSFASVDPRTSIKLFGAEAANYAFLYLLLLRLGLAGQLGGSFLRDGTRGVLVLSVVVMSVVVAAAVMGPATWGEWLRAREWIRAEAGDPAAPWRIQFPFAHHNRAAFFLMVTAFALCAAFAAGWGWRAITAAVAGLAMLCLLFTATRGALLGVVAGAAVVSGTVGFTRSTGRRWLVALLLFAPAAWFLLPEAHRRQIRQVVEVQSYQPGPKTSIGARIALWRVTTVLIGERPVLGFGYGFETFERVMGEREPALLKEMQGLSHAHNMWLEVAVESGIPAAAVLAAFALLRCAGLGFAWFRIRKSGGAGNALAVWLALEVAILVYGMSNYPLRRSLGLIPWSVWSVSAICVLTAGSSRVRPGGVPSARDGDGTQSA